jgi:quercetin dioxygenase-like cupin family protein
MQVIRHEAHAEEAWRPGVVSRMHVSAATGSTALCIFEQWIAPGAGPPSHTHPVEEVLSVLEGEAEVWLGDARETVSAGQSVVVPAGAWHGFRNCGSTPLHLLAILAAPVFETSFEGRPEPVVRWASPDG